MSSNKPKKVHYLSRANDRFTKCGRDTRTMDIPVTYSLKSATCQHCQTPNKPFTVSSLNDR